MPLSSNASAETEPPEIIPVIIKIYFTIELLFLNINLNYFAEYLNTIESEMTENGISLNDVLNEAIFTHDQREMVNRGIRIIHPDFQASYTLPNTSYTNHLLHKITNSPGNPTAPAKGLFTKAELAQKGREQMQLEQQGLVTVKSIAANGEITPLILHCVRYTLLLSRYYGFDRKNIILNIKFIFQRKKIAECEEMWKKVIREALERDTNVLKAQYSGTNYFYRSVNVYPYLRVLDTEHYVDVILNEIRRLATGSETFSPSLTSLSRQLGQIMFHRYAVNFLICH